MNKPWTPEERRVGYLARYGEQAIGLMRKRYQRGAKMAVVAEALGVTLQSAHYIVRTFGWQRRTTAAKPARYAQPWSAAEKTTLRRMMAAQASSREIAEALGRTHCAVISAMQSVHVPGYHGNGKQAWTGREERLLITQYRMRRSAEDIARMLERTPSQCQNKILQLQRQGVIERRIKRWTAAEDKKLLQLRAQGKKYAHIGFILDRDAKAAQYRYAQLNSSLLIHEHETHETYHEL